MYTEIEKQTLRGLAANCPAIAEFSKLIQDKLMVTLGHLWLAGRSDQGSEFHIQLASETIADISKMFREVKL